MASERGTSSSHGSPRKKGGAVSSERALCRKVKGAVRCFKQERILCREAKGVLETAVSSEIVKTGKRC